MSERVVAWFFVGETVLLGLLCLVLPRIGRRGLLFGAYVGEAASAGEEAASLRRSWDLGILAWTGACTLAAAALAILVPNPMAATAPMPVFALAVIVLFVRRYLAARALAARSIAAGPPPAVASAVGGAADPLPWVALGLGVAAALGALAYTVANYGAMPDRVPIHFGGSGRPDGWATKSFGSVFVLPLMTLALAVILGGVAVLTSRAKRALRAGDRGVSLEAQERFRRAMARFLSLLAVVTSAMLTGMSVFAVRTAIGLSPGLPIWVLAIGGALVFVSLGGVVYLMVHFGQGGARLEMGAQGAPLTDGLADNRFWKLGVFYVNRDDPSWLVEKRFGFGYTLNFGNPAAVVTTVGCTVLILVLAIWAIVSSAN